jgi:hypothetical protein
LDCGFNRKEHSAASRNQNESSTDFPARGSRNQKRPKGMSRAEDTTRPAATETGMGHRLTQIDTDMGKSSRKCVILTDCRGKNSRTIRPSFGSDKMAHSCEYLTKSLYIPMRHKQRFSAPFSQFCEKSAQLICYQHLTTKIEFFQLRSIKPNKG